ncbi:MAG: hypothetical protein R2681_08905 [Pyrinomonadaceae bacterium]
MKKLLILVLSSFLLIACKGTGNETKRQINFSDGRKETVSIAFVKGSDERVVQHVTYTKDERVIKLADADKEVQEIWSQVENEAEERDIREGLIKYVYAADFDEAANKPLYRILFFEAQKIENGSWVIERVN